MVLTGLQVRLPCGVSTSLTHHRYDDRNRPPRLRSASPLMRRFHAPWRPAGAWRTASGWIARGASARPCGSDLRPSRCGISEAPLQQYDESIPDRDWVAGLQLVRGSRALRGESLKVNAAMQAALAEAIAERASLDPRREMFPRSLAGAAPRP